MKQYWQRCASAFGFPTCRSAWGSGSRDVLAAAGRTSDGAHHIREWAATHAETQGLWWSQDLISAAKIGRPDIEYAEARVIDYLLGRHSVRPIYEAIFAFDFTAALAQIEAPALVLELLTPGEAHFGEQAPQLCAMMKRARPAKIENADRSSLERHPAVVVRPIIEFLQANR